MNRVLTKAKGIGAKIYVDGEYKLIMLSEKLTSKKNNIETAIKIIIRYDSRVSGSLNQIFEVRTGSQL